MSWILPKGIVVNTREIEGSIESIDTEPLDLADIAKFWKVYTTTKRRLLDPTAERLENYWWRIWGSRKRELNGATVASLFATISSGESFVPLRGPPNRDEGPPPSWERARPRGSGASSTTALNRQGQNNSQSRSRPSTTSSSVSKNAGTPHPILKKSRGPSTTGPRPTARFISPHESEVDQDSAECENSHVVVQPPSPDRPSSKPEKKSSTGNGGRKSRAIVSAPSVKRPVVFRRKSSPSSTESPARSVDTGSSGIDSSLETPSPAYMEADDDARKAQASQSRFQEKFSPTNRLPPSSGSKQSTKTPDSKRFSPRQSASTSGKGSGNAMADSGLPLSADKRRTSEGDLTAREPKGLEPRRTRPLETTARDSLISIGPPPKRSQSDMFQKSHRLTDGREPRDTGPIRYLSNDAKSTPSLAPTLADASGQVAAGKNADSSAPKSSSRSQDEAKRRAVDEGKLARSSTRRPMPPTNGNNDKGTFTKSKSQLELVLEKDRARNGNKKNEGRS